MSISYLPNTVTKEMLFKKAQERFLSWATMYSDPNASAQDMYEDMSASCYCGCPADDFPELVNAEKDIKPALDTDFCFEYKGYQFELSSCSILSRKEDLLGLTEENFNQRFPHGVFTDRYVCWMTGHKDIYGHTKEESDNPDDWVPMTYLVSDAWSWGADTDLKPGSLVSRFMLSMIDKFLETFKED